MNWVTDHVTQATNELNQRFDTINASLNDILSQLHFVVNDVNRIKGGEGTSRFGRMGKLEFLKFYREDVKGWMFRVKQFFAVDNVNEEDKFIKARGDIVVWNVYEEGILKMFGVVNEDPMSELKNLRYGSNMKEYQSQFEQLLTQVDITESQSVTNFQEASLVVIKQKNTPLLPTPKFNNNYYVNKNVNYLSKATTMTDPVPNTQPVTMYPSLPNPAPRKQLSQKEFAEKRAKDLCFYCDKKYVSGHKCSGQMYALEISHPKEDVDLSLEETLNEVDQEKHRESKLLMSECYLMISLNALSGIPTYNTMRMKSNVAKHILHSLLDTGSTHNFFDLFTTKKLGCKMSKTWPLQVTVAGGNKLVTQYMASPDLNTPYDPELRNLLLEYGDVFVVPIELPLQRSYDYRIPLKDASTMINIRPYRYPPSQKDVIKHMINELLDTGVVRNSQSPFSSLIVMVKKKDGSWRMCIDYRKLNKNTIKDKFPIPMIEELIDELHGAQVFSKLDHRSGYQQIRMSEEDIYKTTFKSHDGHYKFVVMPFGLTNAPLTFQALMNSIFKPFFRRFTLVFINDILVYSPSMSSYLHHLRQVLQVMREHTLYAKESKCVFRTDSVEYLGHIISLTAVATNPKKVEAMEAWPVPTNIKQLRGFLGLTGYYRRFIQGYAIVTQAPVLALPNFNEEFIIETDASSYGIGAVLQQQGHPIAFLSKTLAPKHQSLSAYERESYALPLPQGKSTILVVVDRLSKYAHFIPVTHPYTSKTISQLFLDHIYKLHGLPKSIVSDRDKVFMSLFWCVTRESPKDWMLWLPLAEYCYNTNYHSAIKTTPFEAVYGQPPSLHVPYVAKDSRMELVDRTLQARERAIEML
ncbi:putative mitochondrial protein [Tanacetum coccineum]